MVTYFLGTEKEKRVAQNAVTDEVEGDYGEKRCCVLFPSA